VQGARVKNHSEPAPKLKSGTWWVVRPSEQVHLLWGVPGPKYNSADRFAGYLLNVYLGGGMSSALFQEIREKHGLAYTVYSSFSQFIDSGVFYVYAATGANQVPLCLKLIEECIQKLKTDLLSAEELKSIQDNLVGTILLSNDSVESRMSSIARNEIYFGKYASAEEICKMVYAVKPEDLRRLARKLLKGEDRSILALGPKPSRGVMKKLKSKYKIAFPARYSR
jgi:predicted Zn-dependent peptidase